MELIKYSEWRRKFILMRSFNYGRIKFFRMAKEMRKLLGIREEQVDYKEDKFFGSFFRIELVLKKRP